MSSDHALTDLGVEHVEFAVSNLTASAEDFVDRYGFEVVGSLDRASHRSVALRQGGILLVLTEGRTDDHPATSYVAAHGDGVIDIALRTADVRSAFAASVDRGALAVKEPVDTPGCVTATIAGFGDVTHTLVQYESSSPQLIPPGFDPPQQTAAAWAQPRLSTLDHVAICLPTGQLETTTAFYTGALAFQRLFEERVAVGAQAMLSTVVQSRSGEATFVLLQSDPVAKPGQIDAFVKDHGGPGVQHLAFSAADIVHAVGVLRARGVEFLAAPGAYYDLLRSRLELAAHDAPALRALDILADADHDGQLFQIFARSTHPRGTFFVEVIERLGASTFGSGNIRALYEAVESERMKGSILR